MSTLLGIACGSIAGNTEILLKEALIGAEEIGVQVELVRLADLNLPARRRHGEVIGPGVVVEGSQEGVDDGPFILDRVMACDALIYASPIYTRTLPGALKLMVDRAFGPLVDVAAALRAERAKAAGRYQGPDYDPRLLKPRVGGFICLGGASSPDWVTLGLPLLHTLTFSMQMPVVDQVQFTGAALPGTITLNPAALTRARQLGHNVASQIGKRFHEAAYLGDSPGSCPVCHLDLIVLRAAGPECAVCGIPGRFQNQTGYTTVVFDPEVLARSVLDLEGKDIHHTEVAGITAAHRPLMETVKARAAQYAAYDRRLLPPSKRFL